MKEVSVNLKSQIVSSITVRTLGEFDVIKDGQSLVMSSSGCKKIWELYKFLLTNRDRSFTPEALMDQLWIDEEYADPRGTLRRQMHRLKRALNEENNDDLDKTLLFSNGSYRWNDRMLFQIDAEMFENYVKQGDAFKEIQPHRSLEVYKKALDLYVGDYLPDCTDQHWVLPVRHHYRRLYIRSVLNSIEILKKKEDYDEILRICQKALKIDIYEETFHLALLESLIMRGEYRQAFEHYEYITEFYEREMGIKPSDEMKAIYKRLLRTKSSIQSEEGLQKALEPDPIENAFYCEPDIFKSIYELQRRRDQRTGKKFSVGVLTVKPIKGDTYSQRELRMNHLKQHLMKHLRKGDTFTRWSENQFVVLLFDVDANLTHKVLERVLKMEPENSTEVVISDV